MNSLPLIQVVVLVYRNVSHGLHLSYANLIAASGAGPFSSAVGGDDAIWTT